MQTLTADELRTLMTECVGPDEAAELAGTHFLDTSFLDLGFDSLARVELAEQLKSATGLDLPDDLVDQTITPAALLQLVNDALAAAVAS
jgi:act minimal PKS acyl carrier protein